MRADAEDELRATFSSSKYEGQLTDRSSEWRVRRLFDLQ
jgi:hypothetical protein